MDPFLIDISYQFAPQYVLVLGVMSKAASNNMTYILATSDQLSNLGMIGDVNNKLETLQLPKTLKCQNQNTGALYNEETKKDIVLKGFPLDHKFIQSDV